MRRFFTLVLWLVMVAGVAYLNRTAPSASPGVELVFMGDVMLGRDIARQHAASGSWPHIFASIADQHANALLFANLESPICTSDACDRAVYRQPASFQSLASGINLCAPSQSLQAFEPFGQVVLNTANNHRNDCKTFAPDAPDTTSLPAQLTLLHDGQDALLHDFRGVTLALLSGDDTSGSFNLAALVQEVSWAAGQADWVIVSMHWGVEYQAGPSERQRLIARDLASAGADIIWGHHPHVWQNLEWLPRNDRPPALVLYSLGNAMFDQAWPRALRQAPVISVRLSSAGISQPAVSFYEIDPFNGSLLAP